MKNTIKFTETIPQPNAPPITTNHEVIARNHDDYAAIMKSLDDDSREITDIEESGWIVDVEVLKTELVKLEAQAVEIRSEIEIALTERSDIL